MTHDRADTDDELQQISRASIYVAKAYRLVG